MDTSVYVSRDFYILSSYLLMLLRAAQTHKVTLMIVMLLGKLRALPTHTDIITDFDFREVRADLVMYAFLRISS